MVNKVILVGHVGGDPEKKTFENGGSVIRFPFATSERWKDKTTGDKKEKTTWNNIQFGGGLVDVVEKYVKKGDKLYIEGSIHNYSTGEGDNQKWFTQINGKEMTMLGSPNSQEDVRGKANERPEFVAEGDDGLPF